MQLSPDQHRAVDAIKLWLSARLSGNPKPHWHYVFGGLAGTGKTTIVQHLVSTLPVRIAVCATTGKAAQVLITKGLSATTLHRLIYNVEENDDGDPIFILRPPSSLACDLIICDEASMLSKDCYDDLQRLGISCLFVGDHGQLEPVGDAPPLMESPDIALEKIHRQAADSPIIQFAHHIRQGNGIVYQESGDLRVLRAIDSDPTDSQIIVAYNATRHTYNKIIRDHKGFKKPIEVGESLICLRNNSRLNVFNGQQFIVQKILHQTPWKTEALLLPDFGDPQTLLISHSTLYGAEKPSFGRTPFAFMDYAYAITCHKAQGSQWDSVIVIDEPGYTPWSHSRWAYTAATRASKSLTYIT